MPDVSAFGVKSAQFGPLIILSQRGTFSGSWLTESAALNRTRNIE